MTGKKTAAAKKQNKTLLVGMPTRNHPRENKLPPAKEKECWSIQLELIVLKEDLNKVL